MAAPLTRKPITLSDGRVATVGSANGKALERGAAAATNSTNPISLLMATAGQVTTVDGQPVTYEDILEMDMVDALAIIGELGGPVGNAPVLSRPSVISS